MNILITGARGFIGTYLSYALVDAGHKVIGIDLKHGDLSQPGLARQIIKSCGPNVVVHLAAKVGRLFGEKDIAKTVSDNTVATIYVAQACAETGARLVYASTSEAFGDNGDRDVDETEHGVLPHNLYGLSKRWGEEAARLYAPEGLQILRFSMPYGPGLPAGWGRAAIVTFLWRAHRKKSLTVHRGGKRRLCWIGDLVLGTRQIIRNSAPGVWTVGRDDDEVEMLKVAKMACTLAGASHKLIQEVDPPKNQTLIKRLNVDRLKGLGWEPTVSLLDGMTRTYEMVKKYDDQGMPPKNWRETVGVEVEL